MQMPHDCGKKWLVAVCLIGLVGTINAADCRGNDFGIHFGGDCSFCGGWGPYYLNQVGAHGAGPYPSAFGVAAADWYEPGPISQTITTARFAGECEFPSGFHGKRLSEFCLVVGLSGHRATGWLHVCSLRLCQCEPLCHAGGRVWRSASRSRWSLCSGRSGCKLHPTTVFRHLEITRCSRGPCSQRTASSMQISDGLLNATLL